MLEETYWTYKEPSDVTFSRDEHMWSLKGDDWYEQWTKRMITLNEGSQSMHDQLWDQWGHQRFANGGWKLYKKAWGGRTWFDDSIEICMRHYPDPLRTPAAEARNAAYWISGATDIKISVTDVRLPLGFSKRSIIHCNVHEGILLHQPCSMMGLYTFEEFVDALWLWCRIFHQEVVKEGQVWLHHKDVIPVPRIRVAGGRRWSLGK